MADDDLKSNASSSGGSSSWITKLQQRQEQLAENRAELRRLLQYKREVTQDEKKAASMAQLLAANNKVPGDEWRARLEASERHLAFVRKDRGAAASTDGAAAAVASSSAAGGEASSSPPKQQASAAAAAAAAAAAPFPRGSSLPQDPVDAIKSAAAAAAASAVYSTTTGAASPPSRGSSIGVTATGAASSSAVATAAAAAASRRSPPQPAAAATASKSATAVATKGDVVELDEAALRIQLAKDHVKYVEAVHSREQALRTKSQQQREHALLNEVIAAREECKKHVESGEMAARNQEDLLRVIALMKGQLADTTKELEYARKEIDFTGRECQVKRAEVGELRVELALLRKRLEKSEQRVAKRDASIETLEREKAEVLLDCKKIIKERKVAEDELSAARRDVLEQRRMTDDRAVPAGGHGAAVDQARAAGADGVRSAP